MCEQKQITAPFSVLAGSSHRLAVLVEMGVCHPDRLQLRSQQAAEIFLLLGGRAGLRCGSDWVSITT